MVIAIEFLWEETENIFDTRLKVKSFPTSFSKTEKYTTHIQSSPKNVDEEEELIRSNFPVKLIDKRWTEIILITVCNFNYYMI